MDELVSYSTKDVSDVLFDISLNKENMDGYKNISWDLERINEKFDINILSDEIQNKNDKNIVKSDPISGETLIKAIANLYTIVYSDEHNDIKRFLKNTINENILSQYKNFDTTKEKFGIKMKIKK